MQTLKWVLPFIHWSTAVAHHCSAHQAPAASLQPFLKWICFQICKFLPEQTTAPVFPRTPSPPHPSGFGSAQPSHESSRTAAHADSRSQHPCLWSFVFHLVAPSCRAYRFFSLSSIFQCVAFNWSCSNEIPTPWGRLPTYTKLRLQSATEPIDWMSTHLHI